MWNKSTTYSRTIIEGIYEGADWSIRFTAIEWLSQSSKEFAWPWGVPAEANRGGAIPDNLFQVSMGRVGRRFTNWAGMLLLTSTSGTPAASSPATFTSPFCIMKANEQSGFSFDSTNREISCSGILLPFQSALSNVDCGGLLSSTAANLWFRTT